MWLYDFLFPMIRLSEPLKLRHARPPKQSPGGRYAHFFSIVLYICLSSKPVSNCVIYVQNWKKFGNSEYDQPGPNVATTTVSDDVFMTFISNKEVQCSYTEFPNICNNSKDRNV